jgi:hypothetical protein
LKREPRLTTFPIKVLFGSARDGKTTRVLT